MNPLLERRARLLAEAAAQRERVAAAIERYRPAAALADEVVGIGRAVAAHPEWLAAAVVALALLRPRLLVRLAGRAWVGWRTVRAVRVLLRRLGR